MPLRHFCGHSIHKLCLHTFPRVLPPSRFHLRKNRPHVLVPRKLENFLIREGPHNTAALLLLHWKEILGQNCVRSALSLGGLRAIGRAAALAFARVFGFATVVACLTSAFAFAGVLSLASVFFLHLILGLVLRRRSHPRKEVRRLDGRTGTGEQTR